MEEIELSTRKELVFFLVFLKNAKQKSGCLLVALFKHSDLTLLLKPVEFPFL